MNAVLRAAASSEWSDLLKLASPRLLHVMTPRAIAAQGVLMSRNVSSGRRLRRARGQRQSSLCAAGVELTWVDAVERCADVPVDLVLTLYFHQIAHPGPVFLDLRRSRFGHDAQGSLWAPGRLFVDWPSEFRSALCQMYAGHYRGDDRSFHAALGELGLSSAADLFRAHFGGDDQRAVTFDLPTFRRSFVAILGRCQDAGDRVHPSFVSLGVYLVTLYEHLESRGGAYDVRAAFDRVWATAPGSEPGSRR